MGAMRVMERLHIELQKATKKRYGWTGLQISKKKGREGVEEKRLTLWEGGGREGENMGGSGSGKRSQTTWWRSKMIEC